MRVGPDEIRFWGDTTVAGGDSADVTVRRGGKEILSVTGRDVDLNWSQGQVGLSVTDSGHPFGALPDWLLRQRAAHPAWYAEWEDHLFPLVSVVVVQRCRHPRGSGGYGRMRGGGSLPARHAGNTQETVLE